MEENDKSKNSENTTNKEKYPISEKDEEELAKLLGIKQTDSYVLEEFENKEITTLEDAIKVAEYGRHVIKLIEEERKHPKMSFDEKITRQLAQERTEYMRRWNAMTKEERMAEMDRKSKISEELARKSGAKLYEVKVNKDALSQISLIDEIADKSKENK